MTEGTETRHEETPGKPPPWLHRVAVPGALFIVYTLIHLAGSRLHTAIPHGFWQLLPIEPLMDHPVESIWLLHSQPPMMNILLWLVHLAQGVIAPETAATLLFHGISLGAVLLWHSNFRWMTRSPVAGTILTAIYLFNPAFITYQNLFLYTHIVQAEMALLVWLLIRWTECPDTRRMAAVGGALALIVYTRSLWHPLFGLLVIALMAAWIARRSGTGWRGWLGTSWKPALLLVLLVGPWMLKNEVLFGTASFSSWMGLSLRGEASRQYLETREYDEAIVHGYYSPEEILWMESKPVLARREKNITVDPPMDFMKTNMNHYAIVPLGRADVRDRIAQWRAKPGDFLARCVVHFIYFDIPPMIDPYAYSNPEGAYRYRTEATACPVAWQQLYDYALYGKWLRRVVTVHLYTLPYRPSAWTWLALPLMIAGSLWLILQNPNGGRELLLGFTLLTFAWFLAMVILVDGIESARMKWDIEALTLEALAVVLMTLARRFPLSRHESGSILDTET